MTTESLKYRRAIRALNYIKNKTAFALLHPNIAGDILGDLHDEACDALKEISETYLAKCQHYNATVDGICNDCGKHYTEAFR